MLCNDQKRLNSLILLSIENIFKETNFEYVMDEFAKLKSKKVHFVQVVF